MIAEKGFQKDFHGRHAVHFYGFVNLGRKIEIKANYSRGFTKAEHAEVLFDRLRVWLQNCVNQTSSIRLNLLIIFTF